MRLEPHQISVIREEVGRLDPAASIYLYGSRADDAAKGGDIDLLVVSDALQFRDLLRLRIAVLDRIGWQKLDLAHRKSGDLKDAVAREAVETGVRL